jgi:hypothetical protein
MMTVDVECEPSTSSRMRHLLMAHGDVRWRSPSRMREAISRNCCSGSRRRPLRSQHRRPGGVVFRRRVSNNCRPAVRTGQEGRVSSAAGRGTCMGRQCLVTEAKSTASSVKTAPLGGIHAVSATSDH